VSPRTAIVLALLISSLSACGSPTAPGDALMLPANIVDPESVNAVSAFHSCAGHAYPQQNSPNSGKNYFWPNSTNFSTTNVLKLFAACDGKITQESSDLSPNEFDRGQTVHLKCDNSSTSLRYFHLNYTPGLIGRHVGAGETLGHASMIGTGQSPSDRWQFSSNFDVAVSDGSDDNTINYFAKLGPSAFGAWGSRGLTSPSQTLAANQTCGTYTSNIGDPGVFSFTPAR